MPIVDQEAIPLDLYDTPETGLRRVKVRTDNPRTAFGEMKVESMSPITQVTANYSLLNNVLTVTDNADTGTVSLIDNKFTCDSGTSPTGLASLL